MLFALGRASFALLESAPDSQKKNRRLPMLKTLRKRNLVLALAQATLCAAILGITLIPTALGDEEDKKTIVTFSQPVEIPGKGLPAGTYAFKLLDSMSNRTVVQIFDKDEKQLYATILGIPDYLATPPDKPVIQFEERSSTSPEAIKAWYYPGDNSGVQFVYPHNQAVQIAKRTKQNVLSMRDDMAKHITTPARSANDASVQALKKTEVTGVNQTGEQIAPEGITSPKRTK